MVSGHLSSDTRTTDSVHITAFPISFLHTANIKHLQLIQTSLKHSGDKNYDTATQTVSKFHCHYNTQKSINSATKKIQTCAKKFETEAEVTGLTWETVMQFKTQKHLRKVTRSVKANIITQNINVTSFM